MKWEIIDGRSTTSFVGLIFDATKMCVNWPKAKSTRNGTGLCIITYARFVRPGITRARFTRVHACTRFADEIAFNECKRAYCTGLFGLLYVACHAPGRSLPNS